VIEAAMLLRSVRLENFRAVKSAKISFDRTTVLIGENDCGRSSVMEAIAIALGWKSTDGGFSFRPFHFHRPLGEASSVTPSISIALEFGESAPGEWNGEGFQLLHNALPNALSADRGVWLEVVHNADGLTRWTIRSSDNQPLIDDRKMLAWIRRQVPVFWMTDGMLTAKQAETASPGWADEYAQDLADQVSRNYRDLLDGTAQDVSAAIEGGSAAARQLLLAQAKLVPDHMMPLGELLEEITGKRKTRASKSSSDLLRNPGTAAQKIGLLLLVGSFLRSGTVGAEQGIHPLTLIENPEAHLHPMTLASIWSVIDRIYGQKIIATHSGTLLARARLSSVRRLTRHAGVVTEWLVPEGSLTADELRRYSYHLRSRRASASFARCWLLVEGETEFWLMSELARVCGYEFDSEGVTCVEFAQCGLSALIKVAQHLGIRWHLLADGDAAGQAYAQSARKFAGTGHSQDRISILREVDLEHCFWSHGYADVFRRAAYPRDSALKNPPHRSAPAQAVIRRAIERHSKPYLAVLLLDAVIDRGPDGVPPVLRRAIETCIRLARRGLAETGASSASRRRTSARSLQPLA